jgi:hypothetical protein
MYLHKRISEKLVELPMEQAGAVVGGTNVEEILNLELSCKT